MTGLLRARLGSLFHLDMAGVELLLGCVTATWGMLLFAAQAAFSQPIYEGFAHLHIGNRMLGCPMMLLGASLIGALLSGKRLARRRALLAAAALWGFMIVAFAKAPVVGVGPYLASLFTLFCLMAYLSLRVLHE